MKTKQPMNRPQRPKGFGPAATEKDAILALNARKGLIDADSLPMGGLVGFDSAIPPEQPEIEPKDSAVKGVDFDGDETLTVKKDELQTLVQAQAKVVADQLTANQQEQLNKVVADSKAAIDAAREQARIAQQEADRLAAENRRVQAIFENLGHANPLASTDRTYVPVAPGFNRLRSDKPIGAAADFISMLESDAYTPKRRVYDASNGEEVLQKDTRKIEEWLRDGKNFKHCMQDMEAWAKGMGLLRGNDATAGQTVGGSGGPVQNAFLDYLSIMMRMTHSPRYVFWQFTINQLELGRVPGNNILVPRFAWLDEPSAEADFILDTASISQVITADNQAISMTTVPVELKGYGIGKGTKVENRPVAIPEFVTAYSMVNLMQAVDTRLMHHYYGFEDMMIRNLFALAPASSTYYNNDSIPDIDPTAVGTGDDGTLTEDFLNNVHAQMSAANIPVYENGMRVLITPPQATAQLKNSLGDKVEAPSEAALQEITNVLNAGTLGDGIQRVTGYYGNYCGFMCFESTAWGAGASGTAGVQTETMGGATSRVTRTSFAFGPGAVGRGIGMPVEIRMDDSGQFGTKQRFIWRSIEGFGALDVTGANNQQNRVFELRTIDAPI